MVRGKWFMDKMWDRHTNKNHLLSYYSLVDAVMLHHDVSYDPTLRHVDLCGKVNGKGIYHHFVTGNNMSTIHCYQARKRVRREMIIK